MTLADDARAHHFAVPVRTLADRRPGHAVMTKVLLDVGSESAGQVSPQVLPENRSWYDGAIGELIVGHELAQLASTWHVLHAVPIGRQGRDIDHLVIGPGGVFVVNTKRHIDARVRVGTHVTWIRARKEPYQVEIAKVADEVGGILADAVQAPIRAIPVLAFVQAGSFDRSGEQRVAAVESHRLVAYLTSQPAVLTEAQVTSISDLAERPQTWGAASSVLDEPDPTVRFLGLRPPAEAQSPRTSSSSSWSTRPPARSRASTPRPRPVASRPTSRTPRRSPSRRAAALVLGVLAPLLAIPLAIGALEVMFEIWATVLRTR